MAESAADHLQIPPAVQPQVNTRQHLPTALVVTGPVTLDRVPQPDWIMRDNPFRFRSIENRHLSVLLI